MAENAKETESTPNKRKPSKYTSPEVAYGVAMFRKMGLTPQQIAGVIGSLTQESQLNPAAYNPAGGGDGAYGYAQWRGSRLDALQARAEEAGLDVDNAKVQWDFMREELLGPESRAFERLKAARTAGEAESIWTTEFERPAVSERLHSKRRSFADAFAKQWGIDSAASDEEMNAASMNEKLLAAGSQEDDLMKRIRGGGDDGNPHDVGGIGSSSRPRSGQDLGINDADLGGLGGFVNGLLGDEQNAGSFTQLGAGLGGIIGGMPGALIGKGLGVMADSAREDEGEGFGGFLDGVGDFVEDIFGVGTAPATSKGGSSGTGGSTSGGSGGGGGGGGFFGSIGDAIEGAVSAVGDALSDAFGGGGNQSSGGSSSASHDPSASSQSDSR